MARKRLRPAATRQQELVPFRDTCVATVEKKARLRTLRDLDAAALSLARRMFSCQKNDWATFLKIRTVLTNNDNNILTNNK
jgi:hypothetical protein